jgi:hypothetical protein
MEFIAASLLVMFALCMLAAGAYIAIDWVLDLLKDRP